MKKTARLLDSGDYLDYLSGVSRGAARVELNKNPGGVIGVSPGCQGRTSTFGRHQQSIEYPAVPFNPSLRLFKNYRRHPEYKSVTKIPGSVLPPDNLAHGAP